MSSTELTQRTPHQELIGAVRNETFRQEVSLALPGTGGVDRFVRAAVTLLQDNPGVATADRNSVMRSLIRCAQDGLLPDGREAAIVVYRTRDGEKAQYLRMIGGVRKLAAEFGWTLRTAVVYEADEFEWEKGLQPRLVHRPARPGVNRGQMIAAYAIANKPGRAPEFEVMYADDIQKARNSSRSKDRGPWVDWPERMWEKTVGHALFKQLPLGDLDVERQRRILDDEYGQDTDPVDVLYGVSGPAVIDAHVVGELEPSGTSGTAPTDSDHVAGQQAAAVTLDDSSWEGDGAAPDIEPEPEPEPEPMPAFPIPTAVVNDAANYVVLSGQWKGRTLADIDRDDAGARWMEWVMANPGRVGAPTVEAVEVFVRSKGGA